MELLRDHPASLQELARLLVIHPREVEDDLRHLIRSLRNQPYQAIITPAACKKCGFVFNRDKIHKPGKCPVCKGTWISEPLISIEERR